MGSRTAREAGGSPFRQKALKLSVGDAFERKGRNRSRDLHSGSGTAVDRLACVCEKDAEDPAHRAELGA
jgi:hypothetical protein